MTTDGAPGRRRPLPLVVLLIVVALTAACSRTEPGGQPCRISGASSAVFEIRARGGAIDVAQRTEGDVVSLASFGTAQAAQGTLIFSEEDDGGPVVLVVGPATMAGVRVEDGGDVATSRCDDAGIAAAAVAVARDSSATVAGFDAAGTQLFERVDVEAGSGVLAPIGSPPSD